MKKEQRNLHKSSLIAAAMIGCAGIFAGCERQEVTSYTVPKDKPASTAAASTSDATDMRSGDVPVNKSPIRWTLPADWKERPDPIRLGSFLIPGKDGKQAEVAITSFPGLTGTELDNWNRWRREVGLAPTGAEEIKTEKVTVGPDEGKLYEFEGDTMRSVVAFVSRDGASWFFKLRGDKDAVTAAEPTFFEFLKSIDFEAGAAGGQGVAKTAADDPHANVGAANDPHANVPGFKAAQNPPAASPADDAGVNSDGPQWQVPANWTEKPPGMMVLKSFSVADDKGNAATVAISQFPGDVGGKFANVNRWRGQLGLPPVKESELADITTSVDTAAGKATFVDMKGTDSKTGKPARMVAAMVPVGDDTWFYKLTGDDAVVERQKETFTKFIQGVRYP